MAASPVQRPGEGPSTSTYSISGSAHWAEPKSPRSHRAQIERTRFRFAEAVCAAPSLCLEDARTHGEALSPTTWLREVLVEVAQDDRCTAADV
jgi:hypothetical protein